MKAEINVHIHNHNTETDEIKRILSNVVATLARMESAMAKSAEVQAMEDAVTAALENITTDIATLMERSTGLSDEDKAALTSIAEKANAVAAIFNPDGGTPV